MKLVFASLLSSASAVQDWPSWSHPANWEAYKATWGKVYNGDDEDSRKATYEANRAIIDSQNSQKDGVTFGENQFTDMTLEQYAASAGLGFLNRENAESTSPKANLGVHKWQGEPLASSVDWVSQGAVNAVKNQGQCGSCWAFATVAATEGAYYVASGKLVSMSEQQLVDCSTENMGCNGGLMDYGFEFLETTEICTEESYPYTGSKRSPCTSSCSAAMLGDVTGYYDVTPLDVMGLMAAVQQQPVSIAIQANGLSFQMYKHGVLRGKGLFQGCGTKLDHGVTLVGYGTESTYHGDVDYWKVRNSWGASWGEDGYIRIERDSRNVCGVTSGASYPEVRATYTLV